MPTSEKRGRRHSSFVGIVLVDNGPEEGYSLDGTVESFYRASGKGGQHRNKTETACRLIHPSGIIVTAERQREKSQNRTAAWEELKRRLRAVAREQSHERTNASRVEQLSDRAWTWTQWRDEVTTSDGKRGSYSKLLKGQGFDRMAS